MADSSEQVSSTTPFDEDLNHQLYLDHGMAKAVAKNVFNVDEIVDLVGGAQDAIDRHIAEDNALMDFTDISTITPPQSVSQSVSVTDPERARVEEQAEPVAAVPEPEPAVAPPIKELMDSSEEQLTNEETTPDSTTLIPKTVQHTEEPVVILPKAKPESTQTVLPKVVRQSESKPASAETPAPTEGSQKAAPAVEAPAPLVDLLYWRDVKATGVVFGAALLLLLSLTVCSIVSVCSYVALVLLSVTISFRIYKGILQAIQKSDEGHPFKLYLDQEVGLSEEMAHKYSDMVLDKVNKTTRELRRLFLVEDLVDSIKFAVLMWILTYVGALFNGLTLLILGLVGVFSCPIIYEKHQVQIDHYLALVNNQVKDVIGKIQAKVPGVKRKAE
ncbi:reticulon-4-like isoform X2 [Lampris incognitus]|uniref:reticulon-4-like isoform X2 n=1 Tax=Lampris incognitus TaxID=2546036 RepID=UPI0024B62D87|nr:reticulon-4-like isoform X2 [Lampris incognitus]